MKPPILPLHGLLPGVVDLPPLRGVAVFVIGEQLNANLTNQDRLACTGDFMYTVCRLAGFRSHVSYLRAASMRRNLFRPGQELSMKNAHEGTQELLRQFGAYQEYYGEDAIRERHILLCGAWARDAFGFRGEYGRQRAGAAGTATWIPHPSGRNPFYNDATARGRVADLTQLVFAHAL